MIGKGGEANCLRAMRISSSVWWDMSWDQWNWSYVYLSKWGIQINIQMFKSRHNWLVVWNIFYFPIYWVANHPNWLIFFRGVQTTNPIIMIIDSESNTLQYLNRALMFFLRVLFDGRGPEPTLRRIRRVSASLNYGGDISPPVIFVTFCSRKWAI